MKPTLLSDPYVSSYPVLMLLGFFFGWILARRRAPCFGIKGNVIDNISLLLPVAGLFGARFFANLFYAKLPFFEALKVWEGDGLVFYGGFLFSIATILIYGAITRVNLLSLCDSLAPAAALGLAFGRIGCFLAGCCWGDICVDDSALVKLERPVVLQIRTIPSISSPSWPLSVRFPPGSEPHKQHVKLSLIASDALKSKPVHPVQLYEATLAALLCILVHRRFRGEHLHGSASIALLSGYAVIRFATEFLRADNKLYAWELTFSQVVSLEILGFCLAAVLISKTLRKPRQRELSSISNDTETSEALSIREDR